MDHWKNASIISGMVDSHTHISAMHEKGIDISDLLSRLEAGGTDLVVDVSIDPRTFDGRRSLVRDNGIVVHTTGVHPSLAGSGQLAEMLAVVSEQARRNQQNPACSVGQTPHPFVAIGETGLDWFRMYAPREVQLRSFDFHLQIASESGLPVIIHNRDADDDVYDRLKNAHLSAGGVMHCFSSTLSQARRFLDIGMYISFAGNVTYGSAADLREALAFVPLDRLLLETDAPYLAPKPVRGRTNHPAYLGHLYQFVADRKDVPVETIIDHVRSNAHNLFLRGSGR